MPNVVSARAHGQARDALRPHERALPAAPGLPVPSTRTLILLVIVCLLPAWLAVGLMAVEFQRGQSTARAAQVLVVAQVLRQQLEAEPPDRADAHAATSAAAGLSGIPDQVGWTGGVQDRDGKLLAALPGFERLQGAPLDELRQALAGGRMEGFLRVQTSAGTPVVLAYSRRSTGRAVAVAAASEHVLRSSGAAARPTLPAVMALLLVAGTGCAAWLVGRIRRGSEDILRTAGAHATALRLLHARTQERDAALRAQAEATREARRDPLTRLANRTLFQERLQACIRHRRSHGGTLVVLFIDLDGFKSVNDRWGHALGDALLCALGTRLVGSVRETDLSARLSGDEFAVMLDGLSVQEAEPIAQALLDRLSQPYRLGERCIQVTASIGMASFPHDARDAASLLEAADGAMYAAEAAGKGDYRRSDWASLDLDAGRPGPLQHAG